MITIRQPKVSNCQNKSRLNAEIDVDGVTKEVWFEVDAEYAPYLCYERSDAFLIALLYWAMLNGHDIVCEAPVGEELLYQITADLIPALVTHSSVLYSSKITAPVDVDSLPNAGAVGTGISCGVDSFHVLAKQASPNGTKNLQLTHLAFNNVGSHGTGAKGQAAYAWHKSRAEAFCERHGFKLVLSDSNIADVFTQSFLVTHIYSGCFAIYALQKLWRTYFYASSGYDLNDFSIVNSENFGAGRYELLSLSTFSTHALKIYCEGVALTRLDKIKVVAEYEPAHDFLSVCGQHPNCGKCRKCKRTLLELYAIDGLDNFRESFDIDYFNNHKDWYMIRFLSKHWQRDPYYVRIYPLLKNRITFKVRVLAFLRCGIHAMLKNIKNKRLERAKKSCGALVAKS